MSLILPEGKDFLLSQRSIESEKRRERRKQIKDISNELKQSKKFVENVLKKLEGISGLDDDSLLKVAGDIFEEFKRNTGSISVPKQDFQKIDTFFEVLEECPIENRTKYFGIIDDLKDHLKRLQEYLKGDYWIDKFNISNPL